MEDKAKVITLKNEGVSNREVARRSKRQINANNLRKISFT